MELEERAAAALEALRGKRPLVHCITNYVTAGEVANMLLAAGASPIMADDPGEAAEVTAAADALLVNMGTLSERHITAIIRAGKSANQKGIPVILDPVGVQLTEFRQNAARRIFSEVKISAVRGNGSELAFLAGLSAESRGVDSDADSQNSAQTAAKRLSCVCAATGAADVISDGTRTVTLQNGSSKLKKITGAGCMTTALAAAFSAVCEPFYAAVFGVVFMGICGEISEKNANGIGGFRAGLFNAAEMSAGEFSKRIKVSGGAE